MISIKDILVLPNNEPMALAEVTITTIKSDEVLKGTYKKLQTSETGRLTTSLMNGVFEIRLIPRRGSIVMEAMVEVTPNTPSQMTLIGLINNHEYVPPVVEEPVE